MLVGLFPWGQTDSADIFLWFPCWNSVRGKLSPPGWCSLFYLLLPLFEETSAASSVHCLWRQSPYASHDPSRLLLSSLHISYPNNILTMGQYLVILSLWYLVSSSILRNCCFQLAWAAFCNIAELFRYPDGNCHQLAWRNKAARSSALPRRWGSLDALTFTCQHCT